MPPRRLIAFAVVAALAANVARADDDEKPSPARALPDYEGRAPEPTSAGDVLVWVPRVILFPAWLVAEFVVRRPFGALVSYADIHQWPSAIINFFTFNAERTVGLVPTFFIEFGLLPSVGVYFFANDAFASGNAIRLHAGFWGPRWLAISLADRYKVSDAVRFAVQGSYVHRPDRVFYGLGPESSRDLRSKFADDRYAAGLSLTLTPGTIVTLGLAAGVRGEVYRGDGCCGNPTLDERIADGELPAPPGYKEDFAVLYQSATVTVDTRTRAHNSGLRAELRGETAVDPQHDGPRWIRYGGSLGGSLDLTGHNRVMSLGADVDFVDPLDTDVAVPFVEQVTLGGLGHLRGFPAGRLVDRSAASATLAYTWPIWAFLDGSAHVAVGNVFGERLSGFELDRLRLSTGLGFRANGSPDNQFELLVGIGTDTFADGAAVSSVRVVIGVNHGF